MMEESPKLLAKSVCPLEGVIRIISKKWALQIVCVLGSGPMLRFSEIQERLERISPKTLSQRLKELEKAHLINYHVGFVF